MNWKLIFGLSLFGMAMAFATVFWIPVRIEMFIWPVILLLCAYIIAKNAPGKYFLHGFLVCILNCVWITTTHIMLSDTYLLSHPEELAHYLDHNENNKTSIRLAMLTMGPVSGIGTGLVLGLLSILAAKIFNK